MDWGRRGRLVGGVQVAIAAAGWGCWSLVLRPAALPAALAGAIILGAQGLALLPEALRQPRRTGWDASTVRWLLVLSACDALNTLLFFAALERTTVAVAVLTHYLAPVLVALAAPLFGHERVRGAVLSALVSTAGLVLVLEPWRASQDARLIGALLGAASAFAYAGNVLLTALLVPRIGAARSISFHSLISAGLVALVLLVRAPARVDVADVAAVAAAGVVLGGVGAWLFIRGLEVIGPTRTALLTYIEPLTAVIVGVWAWGERMGPLAVVGAAVTLAAGVAVSLGPSRASSPAVAPP